MKKYILNTNLLFHASRLNRKDAYGVLLGNQYKTSETTNKSSKIDVQYEQESSKINIYIKPRCYINNYVYDKSFIYVGNFDTDWTITEEDYPHIEKICKKHNIIPIFDTNTNLNIMIKDILNCDTFSYTHSKLNHKEIYQEYINFNNKVMHKLENIVDFSKDIVWAQDFNFLFVVSKFKNSILNIDKFNELWKCIPFYKDLLDNIIKIKILNFKDKEDIIEFDKFIKYTYLTDIINPLRLFENSGIDKSFIDTVLPKSISFDKNTIIIPYDSIHHMICLDKYINKYDVPIKIYLLNINIEKRINQEILNYITYLQMKTNLEIINPETDEEFYKFISKSQIGFYKSLDDTFLYFNRHIIEESVFDYEKVADEIYKKLHYVERGSKKINDINNLINNLIYNDKLIDENNSNNKTEELNNNKTDKSNSNNKTGELNNKKEELNLNNKKEELNLNNKTGELNLNNKTEELNLNNKTEELNLNNKTGELNLNNKTDKSNLNVKLIENQNSNTRFIENTHIVKNNYNINNIIIDKNIKYIILDYDGTLVPLKDNPNDCYLPENIKDLLINLNKYIKVIICSGRNKEDMDKFIPKELEVYSEHVSYVRKNGTWNQINKSSDFELEYKIANFYLDRTPGSSLERKSNGFVFHFRKCEEFIKLQAKKLYTDLIKISNNIKLGNNIIEYKTSSKEDIFKYYNKDLLICGDDITDEDMFDRINGLTIKVGEDGITKAEYRVKDVNKMIELLENLYSKVSS